MEINYCYKFLLLNFKHAWLEFPLSTLLLFLTLDFRKETTGKFKLNKPTLEGINVSVWGETN